MKLEGSFGLVALIVAAFALSASAAVTSKSYIQDGLLSHWDVIENAGYGQHDNSTNYWTDLKGFADLEVVNNASS